MEQTALNRDLEDRIKELNNNNIKLVRLTLFLCFEKERNLTSKTINFQHQQKIFSV